MYYCCNVADASVCFVLFQDVPGVSKLSLGLFHGLPPHPLSVCGVQVTPSPTHMFVGTGVPLLSTLTSAPCYAQWSLGPLPSLSTVTSAAA